MFDPFRVGLDHVALACQDKAELKRVAKALSEAGVENTGVQLDETLGKCYGAFKDPDRIAWEFYMASRAVVLAPSRRALVNAKPLPGVLSPKSTMRWNSAARRVL